MPRVVAKQSELTSSVQSNLHTRNLLKDNHQDG